MELKQREQFNANRDSLSYPEIPNATEFQDTLYGYSVPEAVHGWQWSTTFNRWSALVTFNDGWCGFTWPKDRSI